MRKDSLILLNCDFFTACGGFFCVEGNVRFYYIQRLFKYMNAQCCTCRILRVSPHLLVHSLVSARTWGEEQQVYYSENIKNTPVFHWQRMTHLFLILMQLLLHFHGGRRLPTGNLE